VIFSRRRGNTGGESTPASSGNGDRPGSERTSGADPTGAPEFGPYDLSQSPNDQQERLDLGALRIPAIPGVEIHLQAGPQGQVQQVQLAHGGSRLSLAAYAAPRTEGIWDDVRENIRSTLSGAGAKLEAIEGDYGPELRARVREGNGTTEMRHVGIDGPRWFVHAVYLGAAAYHPDQAGPLQDVLRGLVVDRGVEAKPVSEVLTLRLPPEAAAQLE